MPVKMSADTLVTEPRISGVRRMSKIERLIEDRAREICQREKPGQNWEVTATPRIVGGPDLKGSIGERARKDFLARAQAILESESKI